MSQNSHKYPTRRQSSAHRSSAQVGATKRSGARAGADVTSRMSVTPRSRSNSQTNFGVAASANSYQGTNGYQSSTIGQIGRSQSARVRTTQNERARRVSRVSANTSRKHRKFSVVLIVVLVLAALAGAGYAYARITHAFPVENVVVVGVDHLTDAEVSALAQIPDDTTLLTVDTQGIKNRLMMDAWVKDANVGIQLPDTLNITVTEREIYAIIEMKSADSSTTTNWALSTDGMWLMPIPDRESEAGKNTSAQIYEDADAATHIVGLPYSTNPQIGQYCSDANVQNAIDILSGMTTDLKDQVKSVSATDAESTTLVLENGIEIAFGTATDIRTKERVCLEILEEHAGNVAYINVRTVSKPTWRSA